MKRTDFMAWLGVLLTLPAAAFATDLNVVGLFSNKALVSIDGSPPRTMTVGQRTADGVTLVAVDHDGATFEIDGKRRTLKLSQHYAATGGGSTSATLKADDRGHFTTDGQINGGTLRFMVDTGATMVALPAVEARRLGINYLDAPRGLVQTAAGQAAAWKVQLDTVRIGAMTINNVDAVVIDSPLPIALLGMSFLNRTEMKRDGETMVLTKRF